MARPVGNPPRFSSARWTREARSTPSFGTGPGPPGVPGPPGRCAGRARGDQPRAAVPAEYDVPQRRIVVHNPAITAVRVNAAEAAVLGRLLAEKVDVATGPIAVLLPLRGCSKYELPGGPCVEAVADAAVATFRALWADRRTGAASTAARVRSTRLRTDARAGR